MANDGIEIRGLAGTLKSLERLGEIGIAPSGFLTPAAAMMQEQIGRTFSAGVDPVTGNAWQTTGQLALQTRPGGGAGGRPLQDTARLLQSLVSSVPRFTQTTAEVWTNLPYARIHQEGGTIRPRQAKMLSIPLTREARRTTGAREWWSRNASKNPFVLKTNQKTFIASRDGDALEFHWLLVDSVDIPQRRFLGFGARYSDELVKFLDVWVQAQLDRAAREGGRQ